MIQAVMAVAGTVMGGVQAYQAHQKQRQAEASAKALATQARNLKMSNSYTALQISDQGERLAIAKGAVTDVDVLEALKTSAEGTIVGASKVGEMAGQRNLEIGAALSQREQEVNIERARRKEIEDLAEFKDKQERLDKSLEGAQLAIVDTETEKNKAIKGMVGSAASGIKSFGTADNSGGGGLGDAMGSAIAGIAGGAAGGSEMPINDTGSAYNINDPNQLGQLFS